MAEKAACSTHNAPWPCKINNAQCKKETNPTLVKALLVLYKQFGANK